MLTVPEVCRAEPSNELLGEDHNFVAHTDDDVVAVHS
jgi:hypothetical protein